MKIDPNLDREAHVVPAKVADLQSGQNFAKFIYCNDQASKKFRLK